MHGMDGTGSEDGHLDEDRIFGLAEGGLEAAARAAAEAHLRGCADCRREVETAAGYFREIAGLEPVRAPANFLANVRARLPRPSPLRAFLNAFMRPLRIVPMQAALLALLGLTAISSYLYQRGGAAQEAAGVRSPAEETAAPGADSRVTSTLGKGEGYAAAPAPDAGVPDAAEPSLKKSSQADASGSGPAANRTETKALPQSESESRFDGSMRESEPSLAEDRAMRAPAPRLAAPPVPPAAEEAPPALKAARAKESADLPAFLVRLAPGKRMGDAVSGLKAMGADSLSAESAESAATNSGDPGSKVMDYTFRVPASMVKDVAPYLQRYGRVEDTGRIPAAGTAPSRIRIRFLR